MHTDNYMKRSAHWVHFGVILILLFPSCATQRNDQLTEGRGDVTIIEDVPFYPRDDYQCGPASLAGVLNYWGVSVSPADIARQIFSPSAGGTLNFDMSLYVQSRGLQALQYSGTMEDLKEKIRSSYPLIVLVDYGFSIYQVNHFMVVVGFADEGVVVNSGRNEKQLIPSHDFLKAWKRTKYWTLLISPQP
jgi:ABC-type bacteriocin/lantibiotic exporter with double-glycine peptidase domain